MSDELVERVADAIEYVPSYIPIRKQRLLEARAAINAIDPGLLDGTSVVVPVETSPRMLAAALPLFEPPTDEDQVTASEALALLPPVGAKGREDGIFAAAELARDYRIMLTVAKQENEG